MCRIIYDKQDTSTYLQIRKETAIQENKLNTFKRLHSINQRFAKTANGSRIEEKHRSKILRYSIFNQICHT